MIMTMELTTMIVARFYLMLFELEQFNLMMQFDAIQM